MFTSSSFPFNAPFLHRCHLPSTTTNPLCFHPDNLTSLSHTCASSFLRHPSLQHFPLAIFIVTTKSNEQKWVHGGQITESLPNGMFHVGLDNEDLILGYISGRIWKNFVSIRPGEATESESRSIIMTPPKDA